MLGFLSGPTDLDKFGGLINEGGPCLKGHESNDLVILGLCLPVLSGSGDLVSR